MKTYELWPAELLRDIHEEKVSVVDAEVKQHILSEKKPPVFLRDTHEGKLSIADTEEQQHIPSQK